MEELLRGYLDQAIDGQARVKEKLRQAREARGDVEAKISRLLALVQTGAMEPNDPALKDRLVGLRPQKTKLEQDIARLQDAQDTSALNAEKLGKLPSHWGHDVVAQAASRFVHRTANEVRSGDAEGRLWVIRV